VEGHLSEEDLGAGLKIEIQVKKWVTPDLPAAFHKPKKIDFGARFGLPVQWG